MLKQLREKAGLTQAEVAKGLGWSTPQFVSNIERGKAMLPLTKINRAAKILKVNPEVFVDAHIERSRKKIYRVLGIKRK